MVVFGGVRPEGGPAGNQLFDETWELNWDLHKKLNFNVKGSFLYSSANVYRENDFTIGLKYYF